MGTSKALLELRGRSFLERVVEALAGGGCEPVIVVVAQGDDRTAERARATGAKVLINPDPGEGPITSLRLAIAEVDASAAGLAYLPVDHPLVGADLVRRLLDAARESAAPLTLPMHEGRRGHPAIFRRSLFAELTDPALAGGARVVVHGHLATACLLEVDDPAVVADIDTPAAYEHLVSGPVTP
jgi:CTP:molybdopterin cytidylyltransferase MocA